MSQKEQEMINSLLKLMNELKAENKAFREDIKLQVDAISNKTDKKHMPIMLEQDILRTAQSAIDEAIKIVMTKYDSPVQKLVTSVVNEHSNELRQLISDSFSKVIRTEEFKASIVSGFSHKVARTIISNNDGLFDKVSNELKQDAVFKSKMITAVSNVIEECLKERK